MHGPSLTASLPGLDDSPRQCLTFVLAKEEYGVDILRVQEIKGFTNVTPLPNTPPHIRGVMNLRGTVVPVLDLRMRFGTPDHPYDQFTVIIVVTVGTRVVGLIVDAVSDVLEIPPGGVDAAPDLGVGVDTSYLRGVVRSDERLVMLLDIDHVVGLDGGR